MKHVRAAPEPPSQRLGRPVSPGLEALILRCLAKSPADRPASTREMIDELARCEPLQPWTRADAQAWWSAFRKPAAVAADQAAATVVGQGTPADTDFDAEGITTAAHPRP